MGRSTPIRYTNGSRLPSKATRGGSPAPVPPRPSGSASARRLRPRAYALWNGRRAPVAFGFSKGCHALSPGWILETPSALPSGYPDSSRARSPLLLRFAGVGLRFFGGSSAGFQAIASSLRCRSSTIVIGLLSILRCRALNYSGGGFGSALSGWARTERAPAGSPAPRIPGGGVPRPAFRPPPGYRRRAVVATLPLFGRLTRRGLGARVGRCHGLRPLRVSPVGSFARYSARPPPPATPSAFAASARSGLGRVLIGRAPPLLAPPLPHPPPTSLPRGSMDFRRGPFIETACAARSPRPTPARLAFDETFPRLKFIDFDGRNDHFPCYYP